MSRTKSSASVDALPANGAPAVPLHRFLQAARPAKSVACAGSERGADRAEHVGGRRGRIGDQVDDRAHA
jgi:hypothetical protein